MIVGLLSIFALAGAAPCLQKLVGRKAGWLLAALPASLFVYFSTLATTIAGGHAVLESMPWLPDLGLSFSLRADGLSLLFGLLITGLGAFVLIYAGGYLSESPHLGRFYAYTLGFMGSMLGLVLSENLILLFVFWELTSISSYFLIGFYHEKETARRAALQALLVTAGGGIALLAGFLLLGEGAGSFEFSRLLEQGPMAGERHYHTILALVLVGAFAKSAQFPFHFWLPNAMEAPAPTSAYLHAATMVKAGIFLLARMSPILGATDSWRWALTLFGTATMVVGAWRALRVTDLKRILAYSTVSSLGIMTCLLGQQTEEALAAWAVFLLAHALYKGSLFLVAGTLEHQTGERDARRLGGLRRMMPVTAASGVIGAVSMAALPPSLGFIGKEALYGSLLLSPHASWLAPTAVAANSFLFAATLIVGVRPFIGSHLVTSRLPKEAPLGMALGPVVLAILGLTLPFSQAPALLGNFTVAAISRGAALRFEPTLWHGWTLELAMGAITVAGGLLAWKLVPSLRRIGDRPAAAALPSAERLYIFALESLAKIARTQTRLLQSGYLRSYIFITLSAATILAASAALRLSAAPLPLPRDARIWEVSAAMLTAVSALLAVTARSPMASIAAMGAAGYGVALLYLFFGAPDLAMTQFVVEALTVILFVLVFHRLPQPTGISKALPRFRDAIVSLAAGGVMTTLVLAAQRAQLASPISSYFTEHSVEAAHGRNVVNVILVDFRAFDTLGEITVLALAAAGVYALLNLQEAAEEGK